MPKYFCDYCDTYLTHDSPSVRKTHCGGRKHKDNVKFYYQKWMEDQAQCFIDATTAAFKAGHIVSNQFAPYLPRPPGGAAIPPPPYLQGLDPHARGQMPPLMPPGGHFPGPMPPMSGPCMPPNVMMPGMRPPLGPMMAMNPMRPPMGPVMAMGPVPVPPPRGPMMAVPQPPS